MVKSTILFVFLGEDLEFTNTDSCHVLFDNMVTDILHKTRDLAYVSMKLNRGTNFAGFYLISSNNINEMYQICLLRRIHSANSSSEIVHS